MSDLLDYLDWRGDLTLDKNPFNKVDALLFALISYNIFDGLVPQSFSSKVCMNEVLDAFRKCSDFEERKDIGALINDQTFDVFEKAALSNRFRNLKLSGFVSINDLVNEEQFSAITLTFEKTNYIVFRGTDDTIVGWKEDFNISWLDQIPSQKHALEYFHKACDELKGDIVLIGHSKGGNLVMNTAVKCLPKAQKRIKNIYNFDGPGFTKEYYEQKEYLRVKDRLKSFYPGFSIVGMIFHHPDEYEIVHCDGFGINQHDPLMWQILGGDFVHESQFTPESKFFYIAVNDWVDNFTKEQRKQLVQAFFSVIESSECLTNKEFQKNKLKASAKMIETFAKMDKETRGEIHKMLVVLRQVVKDTLPMLNFLPLQK